MSAKKAPEGPYTVWIDHGYDGWTWTDYPSLREAVADEKFTSSWVVMKPVAFDVTEAPTPLQQEEER